MQAKFRIDERLLHAALNKLGRIPGAVPLAAARAVNRTLDMSRTRLKQAITGRYAVKAGDALQAIRVKKASARRYHTQGLLISVGGSLPLIKFKGGHKKPFSAMARRPRVGAKGRVLITSRPKVIPHAFVARMKSGHVGVFIRLKGGSSYRPGRGGKGRKVVRVIGRGARVGRLPIKELMSPGVAVMARKVLPPLQPEMARILNKRFAHEIRQGLINSGLVP